MFYGCGNAQLYYEVLGTGAVQQGLSQRPDSVPTLSTITVPVLALAGGEDPGSSPEGDVGYPRPVPGLRVACTAERRPLRAVRAAGDSGAHSPRVFRSCLSLDTIGWLENPPKPGRLKFNQRLLSREASRF